MPLSDKDLPLEEGDHVLMDRSMSIPSHDDSTIYPMIRAGLGGMVKEVYKGGQAVIEFRGTEYVFEHPKWEVTLYRRSQHSKRRK